MSNSKLKRNELIGRIVLLSRIPPGKNSDGYFTKEQLKALYLWMMEQNQQIDTLSKQIQAIAERVLTNGKSLPTSESEGF